MTKKRLCSRLLQCSASTLLASALAIAQTQPGGSGQQQPGMPSQQPVNPAPGTLGQDAGAVSQQAMADRSFVGEALEGGIAEVQLGQLAQRKSQSEDVKQFGQKMVEDHTQLGDQMKPIAQQLGVKEPKGPSKKDKKLMEKLEALSGSQFDEAYIQAMVKDHKQDLKEFKNAAETAQDPNLKQVAQQGAGVISHHLQMVQQIAQNHSVAVDGK